MKEGLPLYGSANLNILNYKKVTPPGNAPGKVTRVSKLFTEEMQRLYAACDD